MTSPPADSRLELSGPALLTPWSSREAHHTLVPLPRGEFWRDQDGIARFTPLGGQKYRLTVEARDIRPPAFAGLWPGRVVTATCALRLAVILTDGETVWEAERPFACADLLCEDRTGAPHPIQAIDGQRITLAPHDGPVSLFVRPVLTLMVRDWSLGLEEWAGRTPWWLMLDEV